MDDAPWVNGIQQNVECLMATSNGTQSTFGRPTHDAMNGELKLIWGPLQLNTQDAVDMVMDTPIINDGSDGKLVQIFINIEEPSKPKPMLHGMSSTTDPDTFMAAHHITLNGERTSDQSRALQNKIYQIQMKNYEKGLGKLTYEERLAHFENTLGKRTADKHRADSKLGYENSLALLTPEQRRANLEKGLAQTKFYCAPPTITENGMHDLAINDVIVQANWGTGTVISVCKPCPSDNIARGRVKFDNEQFGFKQVTINSLSCNGQQCQFVKEYRLTTSWPKTEEDASAREFDWGKCSKCGAMGSCNDPQNPNKKHQHSNCGGFFRHQT